MAEARVFDGSVMIIEYNPANADTAQAFFSTEAATAARSYGGGARPSTGSGENTNLS